FRHVVVLTLCFDQVLREADTFHDILYLIIRNKRNLLCRQRFPDHFLRILGQTWRGSHTLKRMMHLVTQGRLILTPTIETAREASSHLWIQGIQRNHLLCPEIITTTINCMELRRITVTETENQAARAIGILERKRRMPHQLAHSSNIRGSSHGLQTEPFVDDQWFRLEILVKTRQ